MNTQIKKGTSQVIGCRIDLELWNDFEIKCIENQIPMSKVLQDAVIDYTYQDDLFKRVEYSKKRGQTPDEFIANLGVEQIVKDLKNGKVNDIPPFIWSTIKDALQDMK
jgi:hypothetical protein